MFLRLLILFHAFCCLSLNSALLDWLRGPGLNALRSCAFTGFDLPGLLPPARAGVVCSATTDLGSASPNHLARNMETVLLKTVLSIWVNSTVFESPIFCTLRELAFVEDHGQTAALFRGNHVLHFGAAQQPRCDQELDDASAEIYPVILTIFGIIRGKFKQRRPDVLQKIGPRETLLRFLQVVEEKGHVLAENLYNITDTISVLMVTPVPVPLVRGLPDFVFSKVKGTRHHITKRDRGHTICNAKKGTGTRPIISEFRYPYRHSEIGRIPVSFLALQIVRPLSRLVGSGTHTHGASEVVKPRPSGTYNFGEILVPS